MSESGMRYRSAPDRRARILARLREVGFLTSADLALELGVSQMTVRRDLHLLETRGQVRTVHGGVSLAPTPSRPIGDTDGDDTARQRIAECAVTFLDDDDTIAIDAGAPGRQLALALPATFRGTVITHSMPVMQLLAEQPAAPRLVALGGELLPTRQAFAGPATLDAIAQIRARTVFLSAAAADARGLYARSGPEASVQRSLIDVADQIVLLAPHEVFSRSAPVLVAPLPRLTAVVTDRRPPPAVTAALVQAGVAVRVTAALPATSVRAGTAPG